MTTSTHASTVTITRQHGEHVIPYRCDIYDPAMGVRSVGFGDTEREALNDAKVEFQKRAQWAIAAALEKADEAFARLQRVPLRATLEA